MDTIFAGTHARFNVGRPDAYSNPSQDSIHLELIKNGLTLRIDWPASQAQSCLQTLLALLR